MAVGIIAPKDGEHVLLQGIEAKFNTADVFQKELHPLRKGYRFGPASIRG